MENIGSSEILINFYQTALCHIWESSMFSNTVFLVKLKEIEFLCICNGGRLSGDQMVLRGGNVILIAVSSQLLQQIYNNELIRGRECQRAARQLGNVYHCILIACVTFRLSIWISEG
jgi:hypothetical protein